MMFPQARDWRYQALSPGRINRREIRVGIEAHLLRDKMAMLMGLRQTCRGCLSRE